jgi:hypothetical protein
MALVHDWCASFRGGQRVLAELCRDFNAARFHREIAEAFAETVAMHS